MLLQTDTALKDNYNPLNTRPTFFVLIQASKYQIGEIAIYALIAYK